ncbi:unnamed protein product [Schistosoma mattheei]|uniref:Uncharacterized protein n=1 Tax=Schistosoma mattheei TaxID=31246 RepID=A0A183PKB1_9TREM|nr:unnamed protein product [Schistosoma mattheei]
MAQLKRHCGRPACYFPVDEGMKCDNFNKWYQKVCTGLIPAACKWRCKPLPRWFCEECSTISLLIQEAIELPNIARKSPSGKQAAVDEQNPVFEEIESVIMSPALGGPPQGSRGAYGWRHCYKEKEEAHSHV